MRTVCTVLLVAAIAVGGCGGDDDDRSPVERKTERQRERPPAERPQDGEAAAVAELDFDQVETIAEGLEVPWALAFADRRTILVTERPGRVRVIEDGKLRADPVAQIDANDAGEGGLLGIALHPRFPDRPLAYLYYTAGSENRISRFRVGEDLDFAGEQVIATAPASSIHDGGRLGFGPDGRLYASTGDASEPANAADEGSLGGKVLRFEADGSAAGAARFGGSSIFSFGHRNPQGFDWDSQGRLYVAEHGPSGEAGLCCHDEINLVEEGGFYGWPFVAGGAQAQPGDPPQQPVAPIIESGDDTWAPAGLAVHEPEDGPAALLVAQLAGERLMRVEIEQGKPRQVAGTETVIDGLGRLRAAALGPDGCLYLTTSNTDGRGDPRQGDDRVARVCGRD